MSKTKIILPLLMLISFLSFGQSPTAREKIEAAKIGMITERLNLTREQAESFWPIYREFSQKRQMIRKEFRDTKQHLQGTSEENDRKLIDKRIESKQKQLDLEKEYADKMSRVISSRQINSLKRAEDDFRHMLLRRVEQRQLQRDNQNNVRQQRQEVIQKQQQRRKEFRQRQP